MRRHFGFSSSATNTRHNNDSHEEDDDDNNDNEETNSSSSTTTASVCITSTTNPEPAPRPRSISESIPAGHGGEDALLQRTWSYSPQNGIVQHAPPPAQAAATRARRHHRTASSPGMSSFLSSFLMKRKKTPATVTPSPATATATTTATARRPQQQQQQGHSSWMLKPRQSRQSQSQQQDHEESECDSDKTTPKQHHRRHCSAYELRDDPTSTFANPAQLQQQQQQQQSPRVSQTKTNSNANANKEKLKLAGKPQPHLPSLTCHQQQQQQIHQTHSFGANHNHGSGILTSTRPTLVQPPSSSPVLVQQTATTKAGLHTELDTSCSTNLHASKVQVQITTATGLIDGGGTPTLVTPTGMLVPANHADLPWSVPVHIHHGPPMGSFPRQVYPQEQHQQHHQQPALISPMSITSSASDLDPSMPTNHNEHLHPPDLNYNHNPGSHSRALVQRCAGDQDGKANADTNGAVHQHEEMEQTPASENDDGVAMGANANDNGNGNDNSHGGTGGHGQPQQDHQGHDTNNPHPHDSQDHSHNTSTSTIPTSPPTSQTKTQQQQEDTSNTDANSTDNNHNNTDMSMDMDTTTTASTPPRNNQHPSTPSHHHHHPNTNPNNNDEPNNTTAKKDIIQDTFTMLQTLQTQRHLEVQTLIKLRKQVAQVKMQLKSHSHEAGEEMVKMQAEEKERVRRCMRRRRRRCRKGVEQEKEGNVDRGAVGKTMEEEEDDDDDESAITRSDQQSLGGAWTTAPTTSSFFSSPHYENDDYSSEDDSSNSDKSCSSSSSIMSMEEGEQDDTIDRAAIEREFLEINRAFMNTLMEQERQKQERDEEEERRQRRERRARLKRLKEQQAKQGGDDALIVIGNGLDGCDDIHHDGTKHVAGCSSVKEENVTMDDASLDSPKGRMDSVTQRDISANDNNDVDNDDDDESDFEGNLVWLDPVEVAQIKKQCFDSKLTSSKMERQIAFLRGICDQVVKSLLEDLHDVHTERRKAKQAMVMQLQALREDAAQVEETNRKNLNELKEKGEQLRTDAESCEKTNKALKESIATMESDRAQMELDMINQLAVLSEEKIMMEEDFAAKLTCKEETAKVMKEQMQKMQFDIVASGLVPLSSPVASSASPVMGEKAQRKRPSRRRSKSDSSSTSSMKRGSELQKSTIIENAARATATASTSTETRCDKSRARKISSLWSNEAPMAEVEVKTQESPYPDTPNNQSERGRNSFFPSLPWTTSLHNESNKELGSREHTENNFQIAPPWTPATVSLVHHQLVGAARVLGFIGGDHTSDLSRLTATTPPASPAATEKTGSNHFPAHLASYNLFAIAIDILEPLDNILKNQVNYNEDDAVDCWQTSKSNFSFSEETSLACATNVNDEKARKQLAEESNQDEVGRKTDISSASTPLRSHALRSDPGLRDSSSTTLGEIRHELMLMLQPCTIDLELYENALKAVRGGTRRMSLRTRRAKVRGAPVRALYFSPKAMLSYQGQKILSEVSSKAYEPIDTMSDQVPLEEQPSEIHGNGKIGKEDEVAGALGSEGETHPPSYLNLRSRRHRKNQRFLPARPTMMTLSEQCHRSFNSTLTSSKRVNRNKNSKDTFGGWGRPEILK